MFFLLIYIFCKCKWLFCEHLSTLSIVTTLISESILNELPLIILHTFWSLSCFIVEKPIVIDDNEKCNTFIFCNCNLNIG